MLTQFTTALCRLLKHNLAQYDNDASAAMTGSLYLLSLGMVAANPWRLPTFNAIYGEDSAQNIRQQLSQHTLLSLVWFRARKRGLSCYMAAAGRDPHEYTRLHYS
jgi:hypothetical protein